MTRYGRVQDGRIFEIISTDADIADLYAPTLIWVDLTAWPDCVVGWTATETTDGWLLTEYVPPPPTPEEILASQSVKLQQLTQLAASQKTALTNRIGVINDGIELGEATPAEVAELPVRQAQLIEWKRYALYLGRVTTQVGWPPDVVWPTQPAEGMDLTVSAAAPETI